MSFKRFSFYYNQAHTHGINALPAAGMATNPFTNILLVLMFILILGISAPITGCTTTNLYINFPLVLLLLLRVKHSDHNYSFLRFLSRECFSTTYIVLIALFLFNSSLQAGDFEQELQKNRSALEKLQEEISSLREQLSQSRSQETSLLKQIELLDREMSLVARAKVLLKKESAILADKISDVNGQLADAGQRYQQLKELYSRRIVYMYKYGRLRNLELILSAESFNQAIIRYRYLKQIAEQDEHTILAIEKRKREIQALRGELANNLSRKVANLQAKEKEERIYQVNKQNKSGLLKNLRGNLTTYQKQLAQKKEEKEKLAGLILALERKRQEMERNKQAAKQKKQTPERQDYVDIDYDDFRRAKGKLPWPVKGRISSRYGKQFDPLSKTYTKNTDVTIQSALGTPVKCVFKGIVRMITYVPGYGNTIIVDHGDGFYTVYSHVDEIFVQENDVVANGKVIASVGDSGSLTGAKLQFGIYGGQKTYNPEDWLQ